MIMGKKALLMILDGWGLGKHGKGDVIYNTPTPYLDYLNAVSSHSQLQASGENVGLPAVKWAIRKLVTLILVLDELYIKTW